MKAQQGHRYMLDGQTDVIALESGSFVRVAMIVKKDLTGFLPLSYRVDAERLKPQPMKYFAGQVPA